MPWSSGEEVRASSFHPAVAHPIERGDAEWQRLWSVVALEGSPQILDERESARRRRASKAEQPQSFGGAIANLLGVSRRIDRRHSQALTDLGEAPTP